MFTSENVYNPHVMTGSWKKWDIKKVRNTEKSTHTCTCPRDDTRRLRKAIETKTMTGLSGDTLWNNIAILLFDSFFLEGRYPQVTANGSTDICLKKKNGLKDLKTQTPLPRHIDPSFNDSIIKIVTTRHCVSPEVVWEEDMAPLTKYLATKSIIKNTTITE